MRCIVLDSPATPSWADAVAALSARGPLPARTVLVPSEPHAHALRRALASSGRGAALAGTRIVGPLTAAIEVLRGAGAPFSPGEDALRAARLLALFREDRSTGSGPGLALEHFDPELLRTARGWDRAFASAIADLEAAGLSPADLPADTAASRDLAQVWTRAAAAAGRSLGAARIQLEAAALLAREPRAWPFHGPAIALATGHEDAARAGFLAAIPEVTLALRVVPPMRARLLDRVERLYGAEARTALQDARRPPLAPKGGAERDLLAAYLFADAKALADPARPRSAGPDGTVDLEEHAGVEAELEATATWVSRQVLERKLPLEEIAVLVPARDPLAQLVADRLERLPFEGGPLPVHVEGGVPAVATAAGARMLGVLRALASCLPADALAGVLPALRLAEPPGEPERAHLSHAEAIELAYGLGTLGGNAARPEGALDWAARASGRIAELEEDLSHARAGEDSASRDAARMERQLGNLRAIQPSLATLAGVAFSVVGDATLELLWTELHAFLRRCLLAPGDGPAILARLAESVEAACAGGLGRMLTGHDALAAVEDRLRALRVPRGRFGAAAIHVGTVRDAAGLDFAAVRVVGLCEGALPSAPVEDPVLPERARAALERAAPGRVLPRAEDRVAAQPHRHAAAVRGARDALALSAPRVDLARTEREPASLFVDAAAALARPDAATGERADAVASTAALRRDAFRPAAAAAAAFRAARPITEASWLDRTARAGAEPPPRWARDPVLDLGRVAALCASIGKLGPADGVLAPGEPFPPIPGLAADCPISASGLKDLFTCPRMFLMKRILGWEEEAGAPSVRELEADAYGKLLHGALEAFYRAHGAEVAARARSLPEWLATARDLADRELDAALRTYPLVGERVRARERERLHDGVRAFLAYDWRGPARRYVGVELPFGDDAPLEVPAGGRTLFVRGFIDRVDVERGQTVVRDVKSGKPHPRAGDEEAPSPVLDVQLGLYQLAATRLAERWGTPAEVIAAYSYASGRGAVQERAFRGDDAALLAARTGEWLAAAARILADRAFAPTPDEDDCTFCPFKPLCGASAAKRAREALAAEEGALAAFRDARSAEPVEGDEA